jgi:type VI secretion system secreted protein Hcp
MGLWARTGRLSKALLLIGAGAAGGGAAIAVASVPDSNGVIHACYSVNGGNPATTGPNLTVIDPSAGQSCNTSSSPAGAPPGQKTLTWNQTGPPGPSGAAGPAGPQGAPGQTATVTQGGAPPPPTGGGSLGEVTMGTGRGAPTFDLYGYSFGSSQGGTSGSSSSGAAAGKIKFEDFSFTKKVDKASPKLLVACASGQHFPKVTVTLRKGKQKQPYLVVTMSNVLISSFQTSSKSGSSAHDSLSLNFTKIQFKYSSQKAGGKAPPLNIVKVLHS